MSYRRHKINKGMWANRPNWMNRIQSNEEMNLKQVKAAQGEIDNYDKKFTEFRQKAKEVAANQPITDHVVAQASQVGGNLADKGCTTAKADDVQKQHIPIEQQTIRTQPQRYV